MVLPNMSLEGKVALVTGAGSGIGKATAIALAESGADCALGELPERMANLDPVCATTRALGRRAAPLPLRLPDLESIDAFVAGAVRELGRIDLLVNNAG